MKTIEVNKLYKGDCLKILHRIPNRFIDLIITSPPYDKLRKYHGRKFNFKKIAKELYRVMKKGGVLVWIVGDQRIDFCESLTSFKQAIYFVEECGFNLIDTMIYEKNGTRLDSTTWKIYNQLFEYMFILCRGKPKTFNPLRSNKISKYISNKTKIWTSRQPDDTLRKNIYVPNKIDKIRGNIWKYNVGFNSSTKDKIAFQNPAIFPEKLAEDHILSWSNEGDLVYDPFGGSGTTAKMAIKNDRRWILSEISSVYCKIIEQRLKEPIKQIKRKEKILDWLKED